MTICSNASHPKVYSTEREIYFCPFCNEKASTPYNIAREEGISLYNYQREILNTDGHRLMVGARQVGKTTTAMLEVVQRSREGKVLHLSHMEQVRGNRFIDYIHEGNVVINQDMRKVDFTKHDFLVIDEPIHLYKSDLLGFQNWILKNFQSSLICGTPSDSKHQFLRRVFKDTRFKMWHIPMSGCPGVSPTDEGLMRQQMNPQMEKREIDAEFV